MKFYGQFNPPVDAFIFNRYFANIKFKGVFIECGAFDGVTESCCKFFEETMGWSGYNLEPVPLLYQQLCNNRPLSQNFNIGLSNVNGSSSFTHVEHPIHGLNFGNGSLRHGEAHKADLVESGCIFHEIEVSLKTWKDFVTERLINHIDLFVLDVEGHELSVIDGMMNCNILPSVFCVEIGHIKQEAISSKLTALGYRYDTSSHANAFFIKKEMQSFFYRQRIVYGIKNLFFRTIKKALSRIQRISYKAKNILSKI